MEEVKAKAAAVETIESQQMTEAREIIELLKMLTNEEKREVKGIMIGLKMSRERRFQSA